MESNVFFSMGQEQLDKIRSREDFFSKQLWNHDHLIFDTSAIMWRKYVNAVGALIGYDVDAFYERLYAVAAAIQAAKYPAGDERYILIPESCVCEIVKKANNLSGDELPETVQSGRLGLQRVTKLMDLGVVAVVDDGTLGAFGDGALASMATLCNSRKRLLYIVMDKPLGSDLLNMRNMESIRMHHSVHYIDRFGLLGAVRSKSQEPIGSAERSVQKAMPVSSPRGFGSIPRYSFEGLLPEMPDVALNAQGEMEEGDVLLDIIGTPVTLGEEIASGSESQIFRLEGSNEYIVKVFACPTAWKQRKTELLCSRNFELPMAILPEKPVYQDGRFRGYVMRYAENSIPLGYLFNGASRKKYIPDWDRREYLRLAKSIAHAFYVCHVKGILLGDVSDSNVRVYLDANGHADPERVCIIDVDSAQFGIDGKVYAPDGITVSYAAPEVLREGWTRGQLRSYSSELFSVNLLVARALMAGLHPFRALNVAEDDPEFDEVDAIRDVKFPYGSSTVRKAKGVESVGLGAFLWSYMPKQLKSKLHETFTVPEKRMPLMELISAIDAYIDWLNKESTVKEFAQARWLAPTQFKSYMTQCKHCGKEFDVANSSGWWSRKSANGEDEFICPQCAAEPVVMCQVCGTNAAQTRGEAFVGKRARSMCPECFERGKKLLSHIAQCKDCGRSFAVSYGEAASNPNQCPICRSKTAEG